MFKGYYYSLIFAWFLAFNSFGQETNFDYVISGFDHGDYNEVFNQLGKIDSTKISFYDKATLFYYYAEYYNDTDKHALAYKYVTSAKSIFTSINKITDISDCNMLAIDIISHQNELKDVEKLIQNIISEELPQLEGTDENEKLGQIYIKIGNRFVISKNRQEALNYYNKAKNIFSTNNNVQKIADCNENIAIAFDYIEPVKLDSAIHYYRLSESDFKKLNNIDALAANYNNQSFIHKKLKNYEKSILFLLKADSLHLTENVNKTKLIFYENLAELYGLSNNYENQSYYLNKQLELRNTINDNKQNIAISEIQEKYDNEKLRADNLESEAQRKKNQNIAIGLGSSLILGSIIAFLIFKNTKRKQKLAEQDKELQTQKLAVVLKEQELTAIDAMIEGQEKERQRIANDLHDDLGGLMANIKMHFSALEKEKEPKELFDKTNHLIDEAYQKIRTVAHVKNAGVIANKGLLKAINQLADSVSAANKIKIEVIDHGLENRLENSLELTLFRIIQELVTNIIKHSGATEASIHLTNHDESLNIVVEDNGKGFDQKAINNKNSGMGIDSIDKRISNLDGQLFIDSELGHGSTIIIDIPL